VVSQYAAFLRGMNVGGHRLTNEELRSCFLEMGFREVASFRASGNIVFAGEASEAGRERPDAVTARIEQGLAASLGYAVPTFIRSKREVRAIAAKQPFDAEHVPSSVGKLHVALLSTAPSPRVREEVLSLAGDSDRLAFGRRELYWLPSGRMLDSGLDLKAVEGLLGTMTLRTKSTIELIASRHFAE
jgi:uncharacterized protein (DUF1697 family)